MGFFRNLVLLSAFVLLALGGYLYFVSSEAPNFFLWGDLKTNALILFLVGGTRHTQRKLKKPEKRLCKT